VTPGGTAPAPGRQWTFGLWLAGALWTLPLWLAPFPPMVDFAQQLAAAAILRFYGEPARALSAAYRLVPWRPHGLFEMVAAALAWLVPIDVAGKLTVAVSLAAVPPCVLALCRRTGRPAWYALLALAVTYGYVFYWGLVDNLVACPLLLAGIALADRWLDRPFGVREWAVLALWGLLFYPAHLQLLPLFAGALGWLALARRPRPRQLALWLSPLLPGLALGVGALGWVHFHTAEAMTAYRQRLEAEPARFGSPLAKLAALPGLLFGAHTDGTQYLLAILLLAVIGLLTVPRPAAAAPAGGGGWLYRTRFATLAAWMWLLYLALPVYEKGYLLSERLAPVAFLLTLPALPLPPAGRTRAVAALVGCLLALQLLQTTAGFLSFAAETDGVGELLAPTAPGQAMAGLIFDPYPEAWDVPAMNHLAAYYQVFKGGRLHFSFAQFFNSPVAYRPGQDWESGLLAEWDEWNPQHFVYERHAGRFRYFLVHGGPEKLAASFGHHLREIRVRRAGGWMLVERVR